MQHGKNQSILTSALPHRKSHKWEWKWKGVMLLYRHFLSTFVWKWYFIVDYVLNAIMHNACNSGMLNAQTEQICLLF